jgi:hypothetical protein
MTLDYKDGGTPPSWVSIEPFLDENSANFANKPTIAIRGLYRGYSMPIDGDTEALFFRARVSHQWDGITAPYFVAISSISGAEDIGDKYKFQLDWVAADVGEVVPDTTTETVTDEVTVVDGTAYYAEILSFEMCPTCLVPGQNLQFRLKRIVSSAPEVTNEIIVWHWDTRWKFNVFGSVTPMGYPS